jgi:CheY-like chemotaxis protein
MPSETILIIDDDPDVILFLSTVLQDHGYKTLDAPNGQKGIEIARAEKPDLILLDLMMPQKSGIAFLSETKSDKDLNKIPVIMVTGVAGETGIDLQAFFEKSSTGEAKRNAVTPQGYLEKPVDPEKLLTLVRKILNQQ